MKIKWKNIFLLAILICLIVLLIRLPQILDRLSLSIDISGWFDDPMVGLAFFGFICLTIICVAKVRSNR